MSKPYPEPIEALREAIEWYRRALAFRTGLHKGLTYKAIARTLQFLSERLGQAVDEEQLERATMQALALLSKHPNPRHLVELQEIIDARGYQPAPAFWIAEPSIRALIDVCSSQ